mmetsp:Transcript_15255/g.15394  ORF Transcript_15255/g.15394 Transcript_15255/m.15394 type:complete len:443 (+) Transcript_15255:115-1443(+)|eukprot:CAMPEP_0182416508 /NCGR_PEP_ID=MMETSP1167-20130531/812_1 /TAXON_ID=2988 /ORGANISM="Mallomonas Sp, Strain CCMP3275" /LENGTH=442 /DNA_ID=CAMNT_0024589329 /DNA_START=99 /DNA_END=1427 /DNA_ORIENTATION=+
MKHIVSFLCATAVVTNAFRMMATQMKSSISMSAVAESRNVPTFELPQYSPLQGKALSILEKPVPSLSEVKKIIPKECFVRDTGKSMAYAALDLITTGACMFLGAKFLLPLGFTSPKAIAAWTGYAVVTGTAAIGMWVTAHECGHGAFSDNRKLQDLVGYLYHSIWLVPYFSWQRSHAVHHANTNHVTDGETHVPVVAHASMKSRLIQPLIGLFGKRSVNAVWGFAQTAAHLVFGWPAYLLFGKTGGSSRGITNHFIPYPLTKPPNPARELYLGARQKMRVLYSDVGIAAAVAGLFFLTKKFGMATMLAMYGGPYLVVNAWLVLYTWLQHTDVDIPHLKGEDFSFMKGAFLTVDRPYEKLCFGLVDFLHHKIGSTHVAHHIDCTIPHYNAKKATEAIKTAYPDLYLYDPTPIAEATWRIAVNCSVVQPKKLTPDSKEVYVFVE